MFRLKSDSFCSKLTPIMMYVGNELRFGNLIPDRQRVALDGHIYLHDDPPYSLKEDSTFLCADMPLINLVRMDSGIIGSCILTTQNEFLDISTLIDLPLIMHINKEDYFMVRSHRGMPTQLSIDFSDYISVYQKNGKRTVFDIKLDEKILNDRIKMSYQSLCDIFEFNEQLNLDLLYLTDVSQIRNLTGFSTTFAYRGKFACILYNRFHWQCEAHELTHVILYRQYGESCFLMQEGLAGIAHDLCVKKGNYRRFSCEVALSIKKPPLDGGFISKYLSDSKSNKVYDGLDYILAASFTLWLYTRMGMKKLLELYRTLKRNNGHVQNGIFFREITGLGVEEAEMLWISHLR